MKLGPTFVEDTFAEAFGMRYVRVLVTAHDKALVRAATAELTGYATSIIACDVEAGVEHWLAPDETPDGRPGAAVLLFGFAADALGKALPERIGQCVMTCATTSAYDGLAESGERVPLGKFVRFFGDGYQKSKVIDGRRYWRIPVMDGEFLVQDDLGVAKGVGGGNFILQADCVKTGLAAARRAVAAVGEVPGVITPFPAGIVRSGSKVGSQYKKLPASTNDAYCPTLRGRVETALHEGVNCAYEVVIDGADEAAVGQAMAAGIRAAAGEGVVAVSAGNYGGNLGKYHFRLRELLA